MKQRKFFITTIFSLFLLLNNVFAQENRLPLRLKVTSDLVLRTTVRNPVTGAVIAGGNALSIPSVTLMIPSFRPQDFQEFTLLMPTFAARATPIQASFGLGYQYDWVFTPKWDKLKLYLGAGINWTYQRSNLVDLSMVGAISEFTRVRSHSLSLRVAPGLLYEISDRFFLNLELPLDVLSLDRDIFAGPTEFFRRYDLRSPIGDYLPIRMGFGVKF